jgi:hypothetical protein
MRVTTANWTVDAAPGASTLSLAGGTTIDLDTDGIALPYIANGGDGNGSAIVITGDSGATIRTTAAQPFLFANESEAGVLDVRVCMDTPNADPMPPTIAVADDHTVTCPASNLFHSCVANPCSAQGTVSCLSLQNSYSCNCTVQWTGPPCDVDVNECATDNGGCGVGYQCINTQGTPTRSPSLHAHFSWLFPLFDSSRGAVLCERVCTQARSRVP